MSQAQSLFIAATGQHVGKTTICVGLIAGLLKRLGNVSFMKPVGQRQVPVGDQHAREQLFVDKDVALFKEYFQLDGDWRDMSPVLLPRGVTKDCIDGKTDPADFERAVVESYQRIRQHAEFCVVEGTGHVGVGSIVGLNNARVASLLGLDMVIIASGGLGSAFDELALNIAMCEQHKVRVRGVILNRVLDSKRTMLLDYFPRALERWNIPLIGAVPFDEFLSKPSMRDFELLFDAELLSGFQHRYRRFETQRLVARSAEAYRKQLVPKLLTITPASREDIVAAKLKAHADYEGDFGGGLILTGRKAPAKRVIDMVRASDLPVLYAPVTSFQAMSMITSLVAKTRQDDVLKVEEAIRCVEGNLNFDALLSQGARQRPSTAARI